MKINKMAKDFDAPEWFTYTASKKQTENLPKIIKSSSVNNISPDEVDDVVLADECDKIEKCASENKDYFYNKRWKQEHIAHLVEYASACSIPQEKIIAAEFEKEKEVVKTASSQVVETKQAETVEKKGFKIDLGDVFGIDRKLADTSREKADWQVNKPESKLAESPIMQGIIPIRGGESHLINNTPKLALNQNSIADASVIEKLANSEVMDNGERLAKERQEREAKKINEKKQWEQSKIDEMPMKHIVAKGTVFPTEALNAQPGLGNQYRPGIYSSYTPNDLPERTEGEMLKEANENRRNAIKHTRVEDKWEEVKESPKMRDISGDFTEALKKAMRK